MAVVFALAFDKFAGKMVKVSNGGDKWNWKKPLTQ
jgi:hypothetical protein